jgi:hypothetical protein
VKVKVKGERGSSKDGRGDEEKKKGERYTTSVTTEYGRYYY